MAKVRGLRKSIEILAKTPEAEKSYEWRHYAAPTPRRPGRARPGPGRPGPALRPKIYKLPLRNTKQREQLDAGHRRLASGWLPASLERINSEPRGHIFATEEFRHQTACDDMSDLVFFT